MPHVLQDHIGVAIEGFDAGQDLAVVAAVDQHLDMSRFIRSSCLQMSTYYLAMMTLSNLSIGFLCSFILCMCKSAAPENYP